jgi:hypothetical protein
VDGLWRKRLIAPMFRPAPENPVSPPLKGKTASHRLVQRTGPLWRLFS